MILMGRIKLLFLPWLLALVLVAANCVPVMAAVETEEETTERSFVIPDTEGLANVASDYESDYACYFFLKGMEDGVALCCTDNACVVSGSSLCVPIGKYAYYLYQDSAWKKVCSGTYGAWNNNFGVVYEVFYSNYDIYDWDGNLVFRSPLSPLRKVAGKIQPLEVLKEILAMIPLLIPLLAGYLGLRKALRLLSTILKTA